MFRIRIGSNIDPELDRVILSQMQLRIRIDERQFQYGYMQIRDTDPRGYDMKGRSQMQ
jgi:hypothetical protein